MNKPAHFLKTWPQFFAALLDGTKTFEARKDDRGFKVGDLLVLQEFDPTPETGGFTGREVDRTISYILRGTEHVAEGYCILGFKNKAIADAVAALQAIMSDYERVGVWGFSAGSLIQAREALAKLGAKP